MKKKGILSLCMCACLLFNTLGCSSNSSTNANDYVITEKGTPAPVYTQTFDFIGGEDVMPISGFFGPYIPHTDVANLNSCPDYFSDDIFQKMVDVGVNLIVYYNNPSDFINAKYLEMCDKYGIGVFMADGYIEGFIKNYQEYGEDFDYDYFTKKVLEWNEHPSFVGVHTRDEPFTPMFDSLRQVFEAFDSLGLEGKIAYSNVISYDYTGTSVYSHYQEYVTSEDYLDGFFEATNSALLSNTFYPFTVETSDESLKNWFDHFSVAKTYTEKHKVPYWRMMQAGGYFNDAGNWQPAGDPYPTEAEFMFDANISLAYGAKALQFFPLIQPEWFARDEGVTYDYNRNGIIGANGELTSWGYYAKKLTKHVKAIDHVLMNASLQGVVLNGSEPTRLVATDARKTELISSFRQLESVTGGDALVGCFDYLGGTALYVVNFSRTTKNKIACNFDDKYGYEEDSVEDNWDKSNISDSEEDSIEE